MLSLLMARPRGPASVAFCRIGGPDTGSYALAHGLCAPVAQERLGEAAARMVARLVRAGSLLQNPGHSPSVAPAYSTALQQVGRHLRERARGHAAV